MHDTPRQLIAFDRESSRLVIGSRSVAVPDPAAGNEAMLRAYLSLVAEVRGTPIGSGIELRHDDVVVLAEILDLADRDLEAHLVNLLGVSANDAADVHRRIRRHRALAAAASLTVSGMALVGAGAIDAGAAPAPEPAIVHMIGFTTSEPSMPEVVVLGQPPVSPPPSSHSKPAPSDDVEIGTALVIERGTQPDDPNVQIGDAVTYER